MAESLFYGRNHFWVLPRGWDVSRKLEIWNFLTRVGEVRRHLRNLTWEMSWSVRDKGSVLEKMVMGPLYEGEERGKYKRRKEWNGYRDYQPV
jgi:hypothetical protein